VASALDERAILVGEDVVVDVCQLISRSPAVADESGTKKAGGKAGGKAGRSRIAGAEGRPPVRRWRRRGRRRRSRRRKTVPFPVASDQLEGARVLRAVLLSGPGRKKVARWALPRSD
jgi:hypothetical protein